MLLRNEKTGFAAFVEAGDKRFALYVTDGDKAKSFLASKNSNKLRDAFNTQYEDPKNGNEVQRTIAGIIAMIGDGSDSEVSFYVTTDTEKVTFIRVEPPKNQEKKDDKKK